MLSDGLDFDFIGNQTFVYRLESGYMLDDAMLWLRLDDNVAMVNSVAHNSAGSLWTMNNRLITTFKETATPVEIAALLDQFGLRIAETIDDSLQVFALERDSAAAYDITYYARVLWGSGLCIAAEPDITSEGQAASLDPYYHHQWQLENTGQEGGTVDADIDWPESGRYVGPLTTPPIIAVIDAGYEMIHEDLPPSSFVFPYDAAGEFVGENIVDFNPTTDCGDIFEQCWHGTSVLGILKAYTDNGIGLAGAEYRPVVMPIRIVDSDNRLNTSTITRGIAWAYNAHGPMKARIVCITYNFPEYQSPNFENYVLRLYNAGRPVICASGNAGAVKYPATLNTVLAVGMTNRNDGVGTGSTSGPSLDVVAPGFDVWSLDLMGNAGRSPALTNCDGDPNYTCQLTGSSFAAPLVAGIIAKMFIANSGFMGPVQAPLSAEIIYEVFRRTADRAPYGGTGYNRVNDQVGWGRVNANKAVLAVKHGDANNDGQRSVADAVVLINYIFLGGDPPEPEMLTGDADCNGAISIADAVYLINYIFAGGQPPGVCGF